MQDVNEEYEFRIVSPEELEMNSIKTMFNRDSDGFLLPLSILALLFYWFKRITRTKAKNKKHLIIKNDCLVVRNKEKEEKFSYSKLGEMKFYYPNDFSYIEFIHNAKEFNFHIISSKEKCKNVCAFFYDRKIKLKEFRNGTRVFLGEPKSYKEIQKIKKQYEIEW